MLVPRTLLLPVLLLLTLLSACGGGHGSTDAAASTRQSASSAPPAQLNARTLSEAQSRSQATQASDAPLQTLSEGQVAAWSDYASGAVVRKAAATRIPVYRFYNTQTSAHFYTTSETEKASVQSGMPQFNYDGPAFHAASGYSPGLSPVYRFYNSQTGVHFYTLSESEKDSVIANLPQFILEGTAYYASKVAGAGLTPLYRFYLPSKGYHFYTASATEKDSVIANLSATYTYEGIGYYVLAADWAPESLPHTGVTASQCHQAGSNTLVACGDAGAAGLNAQQDGHRVGINPMVFSAVDDLAGGSHALTSCVKDKVSGLIWEGKTDDGGLRDKDNTYSNQGGGGATDASGYVAAVNASALCGYSDWRLPTRAELTNIVHYGTLTGPRIDATWFEQTASAVYWSSDLVSEDNTQAWGVDFMPAGGYAMPRARSATTGAVRLVRGTSASGTRFTYSTLAYGSDSANNVVYDAWTGLQWRRCEEGRVWNGSSCTGSSSVFTHEAALAHAALQAGWRLPNIKELNSLVDLTRSSGARIDPTAFPTADVTYLWSSTPFTLTPDNAYGVLFFFGHVLVLDRVTNEFDIRLVRSSQ